jgi:hypothetical protein
VLLAALASLPPDAVTSEVRRAIEESLEHAAGLERPGREVAVRIRVAPPRGRPGQAVREAILLGEILTPREMSGSRW